MFSLERGTINKISKINSILDGDKCYREKLGSMDVGCGMGWGGCNFNGMVRKVSLGRPYLSKDQKVMREPSEGQKTAGKEESKCEGWE